MRQISRSSLLVSACYLHACLRYVTRQPMNNASLRQRFGIDDRNIATASRLLGEATEAGLIVIADPEVGTRIRSRRDSTGGSS